ncbi:hypothetical protein BB560_002898 [Smittium megazygosporum]|uniref:Uncharacterized protein n=1 Tax=Smittium megazygosporum TaxID=133381 RepID=A0A2T9ZDG3_9FUNG|nr:hypothetical protein BB560_002898 [Smittium megazygosporum]
MRDASSISELSIDKNDISLQSRELSKSSLISSRISSIQPNQNTPSMSNQTPSSPQEPLLKDGTWAVCSNISRNSAAAHFPELIESSLSKQNKKLFIYNKLICHNPTKLHKVLSESDLYFFVNKNIKKSKDVTSDQYYSDTEVLRKRKRNLFPSSKKFIDTSFPRAFGNRTGAIYPSKFSTISFDSKMKSEYSNSSNFVHNLDVSQSNSQSKPRKVVVSTSSKIIRPPSITGAGQFENFSHSSGNSRRKEFLDKWLESALQNLEISKSESLKEKPQRLVNLKNPDININSVSRSTEPRAPTSQSIVFSKARTSSDNIDTPFPEYQDVLKNFWGEFKSFRSIKSPDTIRSKTRYVKKSSSNCSGSLNNDAKYVFSLDENRPKKVKSTLSHESANVYIAGRDNRPFGNRSSIDNPIMSSKSSNPGTNEIFSSNPHSFGVQHTVPLYPRPKLIPKTLNESALPLDSTPNLESDADFQSSTAGTPFISYSLNGSEKKDYVLVVEENSRISVDLTTKDPLKDDSLPRSYGVRSLRSTDMNSFDALYSKDQCGAVRSPSRYKLSPRNTSAFLNQNPSFFSSPTNSKRVVSLHSHTNLESIPETGHLSKHSSPDSQRRMNSIKSRNSLTYGNSLHHSNNGPPRSFPKNSIIDLQKVNYKAAKISPAKINEIKNRIVSNSKISF